MYLNTSHVKVKLCFYALYFCIKINLNTSHVKVKQDGSDIIKIDLDNLNTSHVKVKHELKLDITINEKFKYISC